MTKRNRLVLGSLALVFTVPVGGAAQAQNLLGAVIGNGVTSGAPVATLGSPGQSAVAVGALSGSPDHYGSLLSLSLLNSNRLLGVDGPAGAYTGLSVFNPSGQPILAHH